VQFWLSRRMRWVLGGGRGWRRGGLKVYSMVTGVDGCVSDWGRRAACRFDGACGGDRRGKAGRRHDRDCGEYLMNCPGRGGGMRLMGGPLYTTLGRHLYVLQAMSRNLLNPRGKGRRVSPRIGRGRRRKEESMRWIRWRRSEVYRGDGLLRFQHHTASPATMGAERVLETAARRGWRVALDEAKWRGLRCRRDLAEVVGERRVGEK